MNIAIILAGGTGTRLGAKIPKQYIEIDGRPIICHCLSLFAEHEKIHGIQIIADEAWREFIQRKMRLEPASDDYQKKFKGFSKPGSNRQTSILQGLADIEACADEDTSVVIHDAVRPFVTKQLVSHCLEVLVFHEGAVPILPVKDTMYYSNDGKRISSLLNRSCVFAGQAPEAFRFQRYYEANKSLLPNQILKINGSTEPAVIAGMDMALIPGDENNFKITTQEDLERFKSIVKQEDHR